jgi:hypothetical protein
MAPPLGAEGTTGIRATGLRTEFAGTGASKINTDYSDRSKGKVHLGIKQADSKYSAGDAGVVIRPILPPERTKLTTGSRWQLEHEGLEGAPHELTMDPHYMGQGVTTRKDVPAENINFGRNRDLGDGLLLVIGQHYPGRPETDVRRLKAAHRECVDEGYISE